jgi:hypothetical protein
VELPENLARAVAEEGDPRRSAWLNALPGVVEELAARWSLTLGPPFQPGGQTAWVGPAGADPKPYVGDRCYDVLQHLLNEPERVTADPHGTVGRMADLTGLDPDRTRHWAFARAVVESTWSKWVRPVAVALRP